MPSFWATFFLYLLLIWTTSHNILHCVVRMNLSSSFVLAQVSVPYVIVGVTTDLNSLNLRLRPHVDVNSRRCFANKDHAHRILIPDPWKWSYYSAFPPSDKISILTSSIVTILDFWFVSTFLFVGVHSQSLPYGDSFESTHHCFEVTQWTSCRHVIINKPYIRVTWFLSSWFRVSCTARS